MKFKRHHKWRVDRDIAGAVVEYYGDRFLVCRSYRDSVRWVWAKRWNRKKNQWNKTECTVEVRECVLISQQGFCDVSGSWAGEPLSALYKSALEEDYVLYQWAIEHNRKEGGNGWRWRRGI